MNFVHKLSIAKSVSQLEDLSASLFEVYHTVLCTSLLIDLKPNKMERRRRYLMTKGTWIARNKCNEIELRVRKY